MWCGGRIGELLATSTESAEISMDMEPIIAGESMRLVRLGDNDSPNWIEYIVVRAARRAGSGLQPDLLAPTLN